MIRTTTAALSEAEDARIQAIEDAISQRHAWLLHHVHIGANRLDCTTRTRVGKKAVRIAVVFDPDDEPAAIVDALLLARKEVR